MARIRNARRADCPICKAIRFAGAKREGLTEDQVDSIRDGWATRDLAPRHKAALRAVDAFRDDAGAASCSRTSRPLRSSSWAPASPSSWASPRSRLRSARLPDEIPVHEEPTPEVPAGG